MSKIKINYKPNIAEYGNLIWVKNFLDKGLFAPFIIQKDNDYYDELKRKFKLLYEKAYAARADLESLEIIKKYTTRILEALRFYYKGRVTTAQQKITNIVRECLDSKIAVSTVASSYAFLGDRSTEIQFFHARIGDPRGYRAKEMLHLPYSLRAKAQNGRFSIPGVPCYYLGNSSYCCWIELEMPPEHEFNVSPVVLSGDQKILNLAVEIRDLIFLNELEPDKVHTWLKLLILMMASSFRVEEKNRSFKSEYIIPQCIMLAAKNLGLDGIAYFSNRVSDHLFAYCAINLALFTTQKRIGDEYSDICKGIKLDNAFNYLLFKQSGEVIINRADTYHLRCLRTGGITNIGKYDRQFTYEETDFCSFDRFLFGGWVKKERTEFGDIMKQIRKR